VAPRRRLQPAPSPDPWHWPYWRFDVGHEDTGAPETFRSARHFAAWLGLTPKDHSAAGKSRLGGITRAGDEALRSVLVVGSTSLLHRVRQQGTGSPWLIDLLKRKPPKLAAVALANKNARIAWKLMVSGERYRPAKPITGFTSPQPA